MGIDDDIKREKRILRKQELKEKSLELDIRDVFSNVKGRRVLHHILSYCGIYSTSFTGNSNTFFKEGKREIGLRLIDMVGFDTYILSLKENKDG